MKLSESPLTWARLTGIAIALSVVSAATAPVLAQQEETRYVTDQFEITMRGSPQSGARIVRMLDTGTPLVVLDADSGTGYTHVRLTTSDTEGYVLSRYLMAERDARSQLTELRERIATLRSQSGDRGREVDDLRLANREAGERIATLESSNTALQNELDELTRKSARVIAIDRENATLRKTLTDTEIELESLRSENDTLSSQRVMQWFVLGAVVLVTGIVLGLILPTLRRKRGGYRGGDLL